MPKILLEKNSKLAPEAAYQKLKNMLSDDRDLKKLDSNYKCEFDDKSLSGSAKGSQFDAKMKVVSADGGSSIVLEVSLPILLTPFKGMVSNTLDQKLEKALA